MRGRDDFSRKICTQGFFGGGIILTLSCYSLRMDDIQLCKEITRLKKELQKLVSIPGE